jgi:E3 ubiquitin-protein ligase DOA10
MNAIRTLIHSISRIGNTQVCRICYSTGDLQSLITPCECSGTMGILHQNCLERWLEISNTSKCEICQHEFEVIRYPKSFIHVRCVFEL